MTMQKRQRELRRTEKAAQKRAKRHGHVLYSPPEPTPSVDMSHLVGINASTDDEAPERSTDEQPERQEGDEPDTEKSTSE
jgi:hypothetical protein